MVTFKIPPFASFFPLSRINNFIGTKSATVSKSGNRVFPDETVFFLIWKRFPDMETVAEKKEWS